MITPFKIFFSSLLVVFISIFTVKWFFNIEDVLPGLCHRGPTRFDAHLSSMAPYRLVANEDDAPIVFSGCQATQFWGMFRHGTRNPSLKVITNGKVLLPSLRDQIIKNYHSGKGSLCSSSISLLSEWEIDLMAEDAFVLTEEGENELLELGKRFKNRFPELLSQPYDELYYDLYHTSTTRTEASAVNFIKGLFGKENQPSVKFKDTAISDSFLRFYKFCDKWIKNVKDSAESRTEKITFESGPEVTRVRERVSERLGFDETLSVDVVTLMYTYCAFGIAWNDTKLSAWCSPFTEEDLEVMQYIKDLNHYAKSGYRTEITYKQACPTVKNVFEFFNSPKTDKPTVQLNFAHSGTMLKFLASLGLYKNPLHLSAKDYHLNLNREWKGSFIDSFAANIVFVLYNCGGEKKVLTLHQEKPITLPGCPEAPELCPLPKILDQYKDSIDNCNLQTMCSVDKSR